MLPLLRPRRPLIWLAAALLASKALQFALDSRALLFPDSTAFMLNALGVIFMPERSYVYGWLIRVFCLPLSSLTPLVAIQALSGAIVAWLLAFALIRYLRVRWQIACIAALAFAWDPTQVINEHLVMTETSAGLMAAFFLLIVLEYIRKPRNFWLPILALIGAVLVALRLVYIPLVLACVILIPFAAIPALTGDRRRGLAIALALSATTVAACQLGYQWMTGHWAHREPAYEYKTGFFLAGNLAAMLREQDALDPRAAAALTEQRHSDQPLSNFSSEARNKQLWSPSGLVSRLKRSFDGDSDRASQQAEVMAMRAIRRDPLGFLELGYRTWLEYQTFLNRQTFIGMVIVDDGSNPVVQPPEEEWRQVASHFPNQRRDQITTFTLSQRFHRHARLWCWIQYLAPFLGWTATAAAYPGTRRAAGFLALWSTMLLTVTCLTTPTAIRYLHPMSFPVLAAIAILAERLSYQIFDRWAIQPPTQS